MDIHKFEQFMLTDEQKNQTVGGTDIEANDIVLDPIVCVGPPTLVMIPIATLPPKGGTNPSKNDPKS